MTTTTSVVLDHCTDRTAIGLGRAEKFAKQHGPGRAKVYMVYYLDLGLSRAHYLVSEKMNSCSVSDCFVVISVTIRNF